MSNYRGWSNIYKLNFGLNVKPYLEFNNKIYVILNSKIKFRQKAD
jgi:hypothetical protein